MLGSVKASMLDAMRQQRLEKARQPPTPAPQDGSAAYNPMVDSDSDPEYIDSESSEEEIEAWWEIILFDFFTPFLLAVVCILNH